MSNLYNVVKTIVDCDNTNEANNKLFGIDGMPFNSEKYYQNIVSNFIKKKELIIKKENGTLIFDLNNYNDIWNIIFLGEYIKEKDSIKSAYDETKKTILHDAKILYDEYLSIVLEHKQQGISEEEHIKINESSKTQRQKIINYINSQFNTNCTLKPNDIRSFEDLKNLINDLMKLKYNQVITTFYEYDWVKLQNSNDEVEKKEAIDILKQAINIIHKLRNNIEHGLTHIKDKLNIDNENFKVSIPIEYLDGFNKGRIIANEEDKLILEKTNIIVSPLLETFGYNVKKVESFFYNIEPEILDKILDYCDNDIEKLYKLRFELFCEEGINLIKEFFGDNYKLNPDDIFLINNISIMSSIDKEYTHGIEKRTHIAEHLKEQNRYYRLILKYINENGYRINLNELLLKHFKKFYHDTYLRHLLFILSRYEYYNLKNYEDVFDYNWQVLYRSSDLKEYYEPETTLSQSNINYENFMEEFYSSIKQSYLSDAIINKLNKKGRNLTEDEKQEIRNVDSHSGITNKKDITLGNYLRYIDVLFDNNPSLKIEDVVKFICLYQNLYLYSYWKSDINEMINKLIDDVIKVDKITDEKLNLIINIINDSSFGNNYLRPIYSIYYKFLLEINDNDIEKTNLELLKIPPKLFNVNPFNFKIDNFKKILEYCNNDLTKLDKYPIEFFECNEDVLNEMIQNYNSNVARSIFGLNSPKIIAALVYCDNVFRNYDGQSENINFDYMKFIHNSFNDTYKYKENINQENYLNQFLIDYDGNTRDANSIKSNILDKLRNAICHFRFKQVVDKNGNILEDKIYLYDKFDDGTINFNIILDVKDLVEITRQVEIDLYNKRENSTNNLTDEENKSISR